MFARTDRLLLRPGWGEDAPMLARAIADAAVVRNLTSAPWPYGLPDAEAFLAAPRDPGLPALLIVELYRRHAAAGRGVRARAARVGRGRTGLLDRAAILGPRVRDRSRPRAGRNRADDRPGAARSLALRRQSRLGAGPRKAWFHRHRHIRPAHELRTRRRGGRTALPARPGDGRRSTGGVASVSARPNRPAPPPGHPSRIFCMGGRVGARAGADSALLQQA